MKKITAFLLLLAMIFSLAACGKGEHTVTFLDETGAVLKTETVAHGSAATAPTPPLREDTVFEAWDTAFDCVTEDLTVTATYREKRVLTVTFADYSGRVLSNVSVKEGSEATAPADPVREGYRFDGWSDGLTNIQENKTVYATYSLIDAENVFDLSYVIGENGGVTLTLSVEGWVRLASVQGSLLLPNGISGASVKAYDGADANISDGCVYFLFTSVSDTTFSVKVFDLCFESEAEALEFALSIAANDVVDQNENAVGFTVIGERVVLK